MASSKVDGLSVTIAFVFRERISQTIECLEHLISNTDYPHRLICVDSGSPQHIAEDMKRLSVKHGFTLVRSDEQLTPNEARNIALEMVETPYVLFIDNDVFVGKNWLEPLVKCAEETGAWLVGPLYLESFCNKTRIHMVGGEVRNRDEAGNPIFYERHHMQKKELEGFEFSRTKTQLIEFHTVLMNMEAYKHLGPLDPNLLGRSEHADLSMQVAAAGKEIYIEPASIITYVIPDSLDPMDRDYFSLRWCVAWNEASGAHLSKKYGIPINDNGLENSRNFCDTHRRRVLVRYPKVSGSIGKVANKFFNVFDRLIAKRAERFLNRSKFPATLYAQNRQFTSKIV
ncbi:MAG: glycosyltransferase [Pseudanabaena sp.]|nr:MAG: glycosyltransferase [Pseudanabaena sp.]